MWKDILKKQYTIQDIERYIDVFEHKRDSTERFSASWNTLNLLRDVKRKQNYLKKYLVVCILIR